MGTVGRRWCLLVAAVGLPLWLWGFRDQARLAGLPPDFAWRDLPYPVSAEGITAATPGQLRFLAEGWAPGDTLHLVDAAGRAHAPVLVRQHGPGYLAVTGMSALVFWASAAFVFAPRAALAGGCDFFWISLLYGMAVAIGGIYFRGARAPDAALLGIVQLACLAFLPPLFLRLTLTFPRRHRLLERRPRLLAPLWALAVGLLAWQAVAFVRYWQAPGPARAADLPLPQAAADAAMVLQTAVALLVLAFGSRRLELSRQRRQVRWLLLGFVVGSAPYVFLRSLPAVFGVQIALPPHVDRVAELAMPAAFLLAIVRHQFLDIDIILRRGLIYGLLAAFLVALYLALGIAAGRRVEMQGGGYGWTLLVAAGLLAGIGFGPLRRAIGRLVDGAFFKVEHDLEVVSRDLARELDTASSPARVGELLAARLDEALRPQRLAVLLPPPGQGAAGAGGAPVCAGDLGPVAAAACLAAHAGRPAPPAGPHTAPRSTGLPELEDPDWPAAYRDAGFAVAVPVAGPAATGLVLLGPRRTERLYLEDEIAFVTEGAALAAAALRTLSLVRDLEAQEQARRRLDEMNRLKAEFLARVAHDLRTPLTAISWTARNLLDGISGPLAETQAEGVRTMERSAAYLGRLVGNLLEVSHLERRGPPPLLEEVDARRVVAEALAIVAPAAAARGVRLGPTPSPTGDLAPVMGLSDKLIESLVNLLDNAVRHAPAGSEVTIGLATAADGRVEITVRDHGPGLQGRTLPQLIAPVRPGEPAPGGRHGFGLGLPIVRSYLDLMGGELTAADHPEGGAVFTCRLAVRAPLTEVGR